MEEPTTQIQRIRPGCGVQGCLFAAVAIFVLLLIGTLVIGIFRFSEPPAGPPGMPTVSYRPSAAPPLLLGYGGAPTAGVEERGGVHA